MPAKKDPPLTDEERARRIRELAAEAGTSDDPATFERAFGKVVKGEAPTSSKDPPSPKS